MIRYARDVGPGGDVAATTDHVRAQLAAVVDATDDPTQRSASVRITEQAHPDGRVTVTGEIDGPPNARYLRSGFDPDADHHDIAFLPYECPQQHQFADRAALRQHREMPARPLTVDSLGGDDLAAMVDERHHPPPQPTSPGSAAP